MEIRIWILVGVIGLLLVFSAFFSGSETALIATARARMARLAEQGNQRARRVNRLLHQRERLLGGILLGNNLVNILASVLATSLFLSLFGEGGLLAATLVMTALVVVFAEIVPKTYALLAHDKIALRVALPLSLVLRVLRPFTWALQKLARAILWCFGLRGELSGALLPAREEIRSAIAHHHREGDMTRGDSNMLEGVLDLAALRVEHVMIHRKNMAMIDASLPPEQILQQALASPYTRLPLWRGEPENIVGILHAKTLLRAWARAGAQSGESDAKAQRARMDIAALATAPWFVPETTPLLEQLAAFQERKTHFALVVDEYGVLMGLITLEDILEEIVGNIYDEYDRPQTVAHRLPDGSWEVPGTATIRELNRAMGWSLPDEEATTIAGLVIHEARTIPRPGQLFVFHNMRFEVLRRQRNQLLALKLTPLTARAPSLPA